MYNYNNLSLALDPTKFPMASVPSHTTAPAPKN